MLRLVKLGFTALKLMSDEEGALFLLDSVSCEVCTSLSGTVVVNTILLRSIGISSKKMQLTNIMSVKMIDSPKPAAESGVTCIP